MPEGPEVRVVTDQLSTLIDEYPMLVSFEVIGGRYYNRHPFPNLTTFTDCLEKNPLLIKKIGCIGLQFIGYLVVQITVVLIGIY